MKKIINGRVYDTEKAKKVGFYADGISYRDHAWYNETLYRKKTGEFFIYGEGGSASRYRRRIKNMWHEGDKIVPLSYESAHTWAEKHLDTNEYDEIFGEVIEDNSRATITLYMSTAKIERAKRNASKADISFSGYIENLIP